MKAVFLELPPFERYRAQFWLFTLYGKDVQDDLSEAQKSVLRQLLKAETDARKQ